MQGGTVADQVLTYACVSAGADFRIPLFSDLMRALMAPHLLPEDKLAILQSTDPQRKWYSLDDRRVCVLCERAITGRQVEITREPNGQFAVHCPTPDCPSVPSDWFYQGNACAPSGHVRSGTSEVSIWE
jgi:hypothetical protein